MADQTCASCRYAEPVAYEDDLVVQCRRYPPSLVGNGSMDTAGQVWPQVAQQDWCGEYRLRPDPDRPPPPNPGRAGR